MLFVISSMGKMGAVRRIGAWTTARLNMKSERGATMVEYGLIVAFIALVVGIAAITLGDAVRDLFDNTGSAVDTANTDADFGAQTTTEEGDNAGQ